MSNQLVEYFNNNRKDIFKQELRRAKSLQQIADIIDSELASYADIEGNYLKSLTASESTTARTLLAMLRESNDAFADAVVYPQEQQEKETDYENSEDNEALIITVSAGLGAGIGTLVGFGPIGAMLGGAVGGNFGKLINDKHKRESAFNKKKPEQNQISLNVKKIIAAMVNLLSKVDKLVLEKNSTLYSSIKEHKPQLSDFPKIIEFIQKLTEQRYLGLNEYLDILLHDDLPELLQPYGLQLHELSTEDISNRENLSSEIYQMYDIDKSNKYTEPFIKAAAILKEDRVFLRGKLCFPDLDNR